MSYFLWDVETMYILYPIMEVDFFDFFLFLLDFHKLRL